MRHLRTTPTLHQTLQDRTELSAAHFWVRPSSYHAWPCWQDGSSKDAIQTAKDVWIYVEYMWCLFLYQCCLWYPVMLCGLSTISIYCIYNVRSFVVKICAGFQASMESGNPGRSVTWSLHLFALCLRGVGVGIPQKSAKQRNKNKNWCRLDGEKTCLFFSLLILFPIIA